MIVNITFKHLQIENWKQFKQIDLEFHRNLTIITGANGSGKTTLVNILARHFGWSLNELATPAKDRFTGIFSYVTRIFNTQQYNNNTIGYIDYNNNPTRNSIQIPADGNAAQYSISFQQHFNFKGLSIPSHRQLFTYQQIGSIATQKRTKQDAFQLTFQSSINRYYNNHNQRTGLYSLKETLLNWAIGGSGNEFIEEDLELKNNFLGFKRILHEILPKNIGFQDLSIRNYEIVLVTKSGDFLIDSASGGVSAVIDLGWQIFNALQDSDERLTVLIDEVENHLHPNMQRTILPSLISAFPNVQFIVTTHSPLIIGSVKDSNVYALRYDHNNKVCNELLDLENKAKSANEILLEVLGVPFTIPVWVETQLEQIINKYASEPLTDHFLSDIRTELRQNGLEDFASITIHNTIQRRND